MYKPSTRLFLLIAAFALFIVPVVAFAAGGFTDVGDDNVFKADIQWMKDAGVTKGCNPPTNDKFCPGDNVTREQMSAFMHRLAVNKVVDAATAVSADHADHATAADHANHATAADNTDKLDGLHAADLTRGGGGLATVNTSSATQQDVFSMIAPVNGGIVTTLSFNCTSFTGTTNTRWDVDITIDGLTQTYLGIVLNFNHANTTGLDHSSATTSLFTPVAAGTHDLGFSAVRWAGNGSLDCDIQETAVFTPFGPDGATPTAALSGADLEGGLDG